MTSAPLTLPNPVQCPMCGGQIATELRYSHDGPVLLRRVCMDCGDQVGPVDTATASSVIAAIKRDLDEAVA